MAVSSYRENFAHLATDPEEDTEEEDEDGFYDTATSLRCCTCPNICKLRRCWCCTCCMMFLPIFLGLWLAVDLTEAIYTADATWSKYLNFPPSNATIQSTYLIKRADKLADALTKDSSLVDFPTELDLVCSGGGMLSMYFLGVHQVIKALERQGVTAVKRMSGASGGADVAFRLGLLRDERTVAEQNFAYAQVQEDHADVFDNFASNWFLNQVISPMGGLGGLQAVLAADHHWRMLGRHLVNKYEAELPLLNDVVYISVSVFFPTVHNVLVSNYTSKQQAWEAFVMTGSAPLTPDGLMHNEADYMGRIACDGGLTDCTPHFRDEARNQLLVVITKLIGDVDYGIEDAELIVMGKFDTAKALMLMQKGQDDVYNWLSNGNWKQNDAMFQLKDENPNWPQTDCWGESAGAMLFGVVLFLVLLQMCAICGCIWCGCLLGRRLGEEFDARHGDEEINARTEFKMRMKSNVDEARIRICARCC